MINHLCFYILSILINKYQTLTPSEQSAPEAYQAYLVNSVPELLSRDINKLCIDAFKAYLADDITVEQLQSQLTQRLDMLLLE